jgi:hypothetical protein
MVFARNSHAIRSLDGRPTARELVMTRWAQIVEVDGVRSTFHRRSTMLAFAAVPATACSFWISQPSANSRNPWQNPKIMEDQICRAVQACGAGWPFPQVASCPEPLLAPV